MSVIGTPVIRKEGRRKVTGEEVYVDDLVFPNMLHGVTVRSAVPRGRVTGIEFDPTVNWSEFTIVTARDVPGRNVVALLVDDQPCLADGQINHPEEPVVLLAHPDKFIAERARRHVRILTEPLPAIFSMADSLARKEVIWGTDNVIKSYLLEKGDVDGAVGIVVEGEYETEAQEQLYIEPNGMIAFAENGGVTIWGSMQCPYFIQKALTPVFAVAPEKIRVIQMATGGGFGGKEEYPSILAAHAALLAWKSGRHVKMIYDRAEDMVATTKRHPSRTRHRTVVSRDGKLVAMDIDFVIDGGAYATLSAVVLSRGAIHAAGPYACDNVRVRATAVATNAPPHGAFRGFGAPQSIFALERHMNRVAAAVDLTPAEFRRRNFLKQGQTTATGQVIREDIDLSALLQRALDHAGYDEKKRRFAEQNQTGTLRKGIGFATFMHGAGFTGSGERYLKSVVGIEANAHGEVSVLVASTEIGQGTNTILSQIAADTLGVSYDQITLVQPDTAKVPNSGPTVASRTCMIVGKLVETAAQKLRRMLHDEAGLAETYSAAQFAAACATYLEQHGVLHADCEYQQPPNVYWDDEKYQGDAYGTFAWAVYVAEVTVDTVTYQTRVDNFVALQEVGRVIHPVLALGQIEGGVAQAIGYALSEHVVWQEGRMANGQMTNYIMPTSMDLPPIRVLFAENPYAYGPAGAKGIGELPMDGPAPAILNAVEDAIGRAVNRIPLLPEQLMEVLGG